MGRRTPLFPLHQQLGARIVDFGGWEMPLQYTSQLAEHHAVRRAAGVFDVSHMCSIDLQGERSQAFLRELLANDIGKLTVCGKALYACMLNESGGVLDDLIVYRLGADRFRAVVNAGTRDRDLAWIRRHAHRYGVEVLERTQLAMLAVQGPAARQAVANLLSPAGAAAALALAPFFGCDVGDWFIARTGYTGEDGFEVMLPGAAAQGIWRSLNAAGVVSCGLGARDTLRLEAGMNLYGNDMDEHTQPFESGLGWSVALAPAERDFIGREALERVLAERARAPESQRRLVGLVLEERGVIRSHQKVQLAQHGIIGEVTSGTFSPTLERSIALARLLDVAAERVQVDVRGKLLNARIVQPPFVRNGKTMIALPEKAR
ncbi:MAG TPA: glycine cleavage system aminomethyltransferase GcvT [Steroidobacteraceae bacterium]